MGRIIIVDLHYLILHQTIFLCADNNTRILKKIRIDLVFSNVAEVYLDYACNIVKA